MDVGIIKQEIEDGKFMCRVCLQNGTHNLISLFDVLDELMISQMIFECVQIKVTEDDGLPTHCCRKCLEDIEIAYSLIKRCRESDSRLRTLYKSPTELSEHHFKEISQSICDEQGTGFTEYPIIKEDEESDQLLDNDYLENVIEFEEEDIVEHDTDSRILDDDEDNSYPEVLLIDEESVEQDEIDDDSTTCIKKERKRRNIINISKTPKRCCGCKKEYCDRESLMLHSEEVHLPNRIEDKVNKSFECNVCFKRYALKRTLHRHQREMYVEKSFKCEDCNECFASEIQLNDHVKTHLIIPDTIMDMNASLTRCCGCLNDFETEALLREHSTAVHFPERIVENESQQFECDICYRRYKTKYNLNEHRQKAYRDKKYQCTQCGRTFRDNSILADHERTHTGERPFECPICTKRFAIKDSYRKHVKSHSMASDHYKCTICGRGFRTKGNLKGHYLVHATDRPLECHLCPSTFARKICLKLHMRTHTGEKPHACHICEKRYAHASDLKRHIMAHTGVKPFLCTYCGRRFPRKDYLNKHMGLHKNIESDQPQSHIPSFKLVYQ